MSGIRTTVLLSAALLAALSTASCTGEPAGGDPRIADLEARFTPGLHALMTQLAARHATLWFAGEAANWPLAAYMAHELEALLGEIEELHPEYEGVRVAAMLGELTSPAVEGIEGAVAARDRDAFVREFDRLTTACNACHTASDRAAIVIQRPTAPPLTNLRYAP